MTEAVRFRGSFISNVMIVAALSACGGASGGGGVRANAWNTERTTVGDTTVIRLTGAATASAELSLTQELSIGKVDGRDYEMFEEISLVTPTDDGGVLFFDSGAATVRRFDSTGKYLNSFGRKGKGPGEYTQAYNLDIMPDGNVLVEGDVTLNLFTHDGKSVVDRDISFKDPETLGSQRGVTADGYVHVSRTMYDTRYPDSVTAPGDRLTATVVHRMKIDGQPVDTVFQPKSRMTQKKGFEYHRPGSPQPRYMAIPLTPAFITTYSSLGYWISGGDDSTYSITLHRREGGPLRIESDLPRVPAAPDERAFHLAALARGLKRYNQGAPNLDVIPVAKSHFAAISTDADGRIWVKLSQPAVREAIDTTARTGTPQGGFVMSMQSGEEVMYMEPGGSMPKATERWVEPIVYDIFAPTGEFVGRLKLPARATFGNARGEKVWLVVKDELDVETLVRYRLLNSTGG